MTKLGLAVVAGSMFALGAGLATAFFVARAAPTVESAPPAESPSPQSAPVAAPATYDAIVRPLLDAKCSACHGETKQKGGLSFATRETIEKGGRHGPVLDRAAPEKSSMLARISLALDEEKHMPPDDHEQLAPQELAALQRWIRAGAPFEGVVEGIDEPASAPVVAAESTPAPAAAAPKLAPADPQALAALREALVHVQPLSEGSPLSWVDFSATAKSIDDAKARQLLEPLKAQLGDLSLARSAVGDETLAMLAEFAELRRLDVRATAIGDGGVAALAHHAKLAELVISQTKLTDACVETLIAMPALESVHLWRSGISAEAVARLRAARPSLRVDDGAAAPSAALEVESKIELTKAPVPPAAASSTAAASLVPVNMKCPVTGAPVKLKYSIVHEGKVIGFCCPECPKEFWADPAKFAERLQ